MTLIVHHLNHSRSQRVLWLLEELGLDYTIERYQRDPNTMLAPESLRRVHPLGKSPLIVENGRVLAESGAIVEYLVDRHAEGRLAPAPDSAKRLRYIYWLHYAEGSAMPLLLMKLLSSRVARAKMPFFAKPVARRIAATLDRRFIDPQLTLHLDYLEHELTSTGWFAGSQFSAADIQMSFPVEAAMEFALVGDQRPRLLDWLERIHARSAYRCALERGGP